jgi:nicotinamide riboside kinase
MKDGKINIAIAGGPCTGKSVLAANVYSHLKLGGYDYDLIFEECRKLKQEFGKFNDPFERFYMWRQQEREELRSCARDGFVSDKPLFHYYCQVKQFASHPRDKLALRELWRMCLELGDRYQLIAMAENPDEVRYKTDNSRSSKKQIARERHQIIRSFVEHMWPDKLLLIKGSLDERTEQVIEEVKKLRKIQS